MPPLLKHNFSTLPVAPQSCRIVTWHDFLGYLFSYSSSLHTCSKYEIPRRHELLEDWNVGFGSHPV